MKQEHMSESSDHSPLERLIEGNRRYLASVDRALLEQAARYGQQPYAIVVCCSDSRVIPERIFGAGLGELFVIRIAGNVLDRHQLGSIEYAAAHLDSRLIVMLGHTGCGAIGAAVSGHAEGYITELTDAVLAAIGEERDPDRACRLNVLKGVERIREEFSAHPEIAGVSVRGAVYRLEDGTVEWL